VPSFRPSILIPIAERFDMSGGAVPQPAIKLPGFLQLLTPAAGHRYEIAAQIGEPRHIAPQLLKLSYRKDVFLSLSPSFFDILNGDIGRHARRQVPDGF
jgi:hypothetical protein